MGSSTGNPCSQSSFFYKRSCPESAFKYCQSCLFPDHTSFPNALDFTFYKFKHFNCNTINMLNFFCKTKDEQFNTFTTEILRGSENFTPKCTLSGFPPPARKFRTKRQSQNYPRQTRRTAAGPIQSVSPSKYPLPRQSGAPDRTRVVSQEQMNGARKASSPPRPSCRRGRAGSLPPRVPPPRQASKKRKHRTRRGRAAVFETRNL